jgi:hypothetical protein
VLQSDVARCGVGKGYRSLTIPFDDDALAVAWIDAIVDKDTIVAKRTQNANGFDIVVQISKLNVLDARLGTQHSLARIELRRVPQANWEIPPVFGWGHETVRTDSSPWIPIVCSAFLAR